MNLLSLALVALTLFTGQAVPAQAPTPAPALSKEVAALQGRWVVTMINDQDPNGALELQFDGNKYAVAGTGADESGTFKLDATKTPWTFDLSIEQGDDAGKLQLGILEVKGDAIHGLLGTPGVATRPAGWDSPDGAIAFVAVKKK
jgi:uncharacterized protein (TIGR03067 family)